MENGKHTWPINNNNRIVETEGLLNDTCSHVHCITGNISEAVQDRNVVGTDH